MFQNNGSVTEKGQTHFTASDVRHYSPAKAEVINLLKIRLSQFLQADCSQAIGSHAEAKSAGDLFNNLMQKMNHPEAGMLADWFFTLFASIQKEKFILAIQLFSQFYDLCSQYHLENSLAEPDKLLLYDTDHLKIYYLKICIAALMGSKNKNVQAQLLNQLPDLTLVNAAFANGLPFICEQMVYDNTIPLQPHAELENIENYRNYKSGILVHIAMRPLSFMGTQKSSRTNKTSVSDEMTTHSRMDFFCCLKFINILEEIAPQQISLIKKRTLINKFIASIRRLSKTSTIEEFISLVNKLKEIDKTDYCKKLFGNLTANADEREFNHYIKISQYLMLIRRAEKGYDIYA